MMDDDMKPTFVIKLPNGLYVAPAPRDFTSQPILAQRFRSRWEALGECSRLGASTAWAQIVPYAPETGPVPGGSNPPPEG